MSLSSSSSSSAAAAAGKQRVISMTLTSTLMMTLTWMTSAAQSVTSSDSRCSVNNGMMADESLCRGFLVCQNVRHILHCIGIFIVHVFNHVFNVISVYTFCLRLLTMIMKAYQYKIYKLDSCIVFLCIKRMQALKNSMLSCH
jgi:hypothetical protein